MTGLHVGEVSPFPQMGQFYAWLKPLQLIRALSYNDTVAHFDNWPMDGSSQELFAVWPSDLARLLWYQSELHFAYRLVDEGSDPNDPNQIEVSDMQGAGPGAVYLSKASGRLFFLGPDKPGHKASVTVLADWDVMGELGSTLVAGLNVGLLQPAFAPWDPSVSISSTRFDLVG